MNRGVLHVGLPLLDTNRPSMRVGASVEREFAIDHPSGRPRIDGMRLVPGGLDGIGKVIAFRLEKLDLQAGVEGLPGCCR